ncbi:MULTISPECIES: helix-turn-helix domain-containing protein [Hymenobacter]|jgi:HTH-type transcriptional regulator/antitoxin HigA|uniref:HTH cro/C1-type domain-containing protein n=2 Tax=Hymenobacter TaxID=89966 RepID=A0ABP8JPV2_9BACT|nr:helix-turn-helix domain-containing protein [Hymenobacter guriensis]MBG8556071.1 helix-turn-helix domain-containing protein [Hymenobacter guriensis]
MALILHTEKEYQAAMTRLEYLIDNEPGNLDEIKSLGHAANEYENDHGHRPISPTSLVGMLEREMVARRLKKQDMAALLGIANSRLSEVLNGKRAINLDLAKRLYQKLGISAELILEYA